MDHIKFFYMMVLGWAYLGIYTTKLFELFFKVVLKLPEGILKYINFKNQLNTSNKEICILLVKNEYGYITEQFKLFMSYYWKIGGPGQTNDDNGFDFDKYEKLFNSKILHCYYKLKDAENFIETLIQPENITNHTNHTIPSELLAEWHSKLINPINSTPTMPSDDVLMEHPKLDDSPSEVKSVTEGSTAENPVDTPAPPHETNNSVLDDSSSEDSHVEALANNSQKWVNTPYMRDIYQPVKFFKIIQEGEHYYKYMNSIKKKLLWDHVTFDE